MAFSTNFEGTLKTLISLGKSVKVALQNNSGVLEGRHNGGTFFPLIGIVSSQSANFTAVYGRIYWTTNAISVQLPAPVANGKITITKTDASTVTVLRAGAEQIQGVAASFTFSDDLQSITLVTDGTNWRLI